MLATDSNRSSTSSVDMRASFSFPRLGLAELQRGLYGGLPDSALRQVRLKRMLETTPVLAFDATAAETYGQIIAQIGWARRKDFDRLIGAHALATGCMLVTANGPDFSDIPGLPLESSTLSD